MRRGTVLVFAVLLVSLLSDCSGGGVIAKGGDFVLRVDDLRFEVTKLGPYSKYDETFDSRLALVHNLAARHFLAEEAMRLGYGEDVAVVGKEAEAAAVAEAYHTWKIDNAIMLPRIKTKPWQEKLNRRLHLKEMIFAVYPVAEEVLEDLQDGKDFETMAAAMSDREDVRVHDLGWVVWKDLGREVANIVFRLDRGAVSSIVPGGDGYHIFYIAEDEPFGLSIELVSIRSKRFVEAMEREKLIEKEEHELAGIYDLRFSEEGLAAGLRSFQVAFSGGRPADSLIGCVVATYTGGEVRVADLYSLYYSLPMESRPYVGDYNALKEFAAEIVLPQLEARAGYALGLDRLRSVAWAAKNAREEFLVGLMENHFRDQVDVTDADLIEYYAERKDDIRTSGAYRVSRILVDSNEDARRALNEIEGGRDFADVAAEMSLDTHTAEQGGALGLINFGMVAYYDSVVRGLSVGEVSAPFTTGSGTEIIKLDEMIEPVHLSFEEAREAITGYVTNSKANSLLAEWVNRKRDEVGFWIDEDLLRRVTLPKPDFLEHAPTPGQEREDE
jgi:parvulin-like peptidyl-prolyl isomerase